MGVSHFQGHYIIRFCSNHDILNQTNKYLVIKSTVLYYKNIHIFIFSVIEKLFKIFIYRKFIFLMYNRLKFGRIN